MIATTNNGNCSLEKLLDYKDEGYLKDAPQELITILKERFKNCEALNRCVDYDFWGFCDCRCILTNKLAYKPDGPSPYMRNKREVEVRNATRFINSLRDITAHQYDELFEKLCEVRFAYNIEVMPAIKELYNSFNPINENNQQRTQTTS